MIHIFGDSHAHFNFRRLAFEHLNHYVNGLTLHRIGRDGRECVDFRGAGVADGDLVLYQAGEVDCRCHIGKQVLRGAAVGATIDALAQALLASIRANLQAYRGVLVVVCCVPPQMDQAYYESVHGPITHEFPFVGSNPERIGYTLALNAALARMCADSGLLFFDYYAHYADAGNFLAAGLSDNICHIADNAHLLGRLGALMAAEAVAAVAAEPALARLGKRSPSALPLVSMLIPTHQRADYAEQALRSALAQTYENFEIVVSDSSADELTRERLAPYVAKYPYVRYARARGCAAPDNAARCFARARGDYLTYLVDGELLYPDKIEKMVNCVLFEPTVGMVSAFRQARNPDGSDADPGGAPARMFERGTMVNGVSMGDLILKRDRDVFGGSSAPLFRKADAGPGYAMFLDKRYAALADVATWLSVLSHTDCVYLPEALSHVGIGDERGRRAAAQRGDASVEWLQLSCDSHQHGTFQSELAPIHALLTAKLLAGMAQLSLTHRETKADARELDDIHALIRQATDILLAQ